MSLPSRRSLAPRRRRRSPGPWTRRRGGWRLGTAVVPYLVALLVGIGAAIAGLVELGDPGFSTEALPTLSRFLSEGEERLLREGRSLLGSLAPQRMVETAIPMFAAGRVTERAAPGWLGDIRSFIFSATSMNLSDPATFLTVAIPGFSVPRGSAVPILGPARSDRGAYAAADASRQEPRAPNEREAQEGFSDSSSPRPIEPPMIEPPGAAVREPGLEVRQPHRGPSRGWGDKPLVFIYHSHSSEAYRLTSGSDHAWGSDEGVIAVGDALANALSERYKIPVVHSRAIHDYPVWRDAYTNSQKTASEALEKHPSIEMVLDIHRDASTQASSGPASIDIGGRKAARVFIVVTTDKFGLPHPNWRENLAFAYYLNAKMDEMYPGLSRGINVRDDARWNQHVHSRALILEIGSQENTRQEGEASASYLADVIACVLEDLQR